VASELVSHLRDAFGWSEDVIVHPGRRGALGQIWSVDVGITRYALKEIFAEPPSDALIEAELEFARRAADAGVRLPASHPDRDGHYLLETPGGTWLRLYDWIDLRPVELAATATPQELGMLLARLHRCAAANAFEPDGGPPSHWYDHAPAMHEWAAFNWSDAAWAARLADALVGVPELCAEVVPADPAELAWCHRDLHPDNVLVDSAGSLVVVDWDNIGPAMPSRELARAFFDWFIDGSTADLGAVRRMYEAYRSGGGPGRITEVADFSMLVASRLNFLLRQAHRGGSYREQRHREWAEREIDEALQILPTPRQLTDVLDVIPGR
jgi:Ser/Thr protein kinase RdoA (MazF antagonist)